MAIFDLSVGDRFRATCTHALDAIGVKVERVPSYEEYSAIATEARPGHTVGDPFNPELNDVDEKDMLFMVGRDSSGQTIHTQALRVLPTGKGSVGEYFRHNFQGFAPPNFNIDFERSRYRAGPGAQRLKGRVIYSGETWIGGERGQFRGTGLSTLLGKYALYTAMSQLSAEHVVGFMVRPVAYKGFCLRMGFMHAEPYALRWHTVGKTEPLETVMVYMSTEDLLYILDLPNPEIEALAA